MVTAAELLIEYGYATTDSVEYRPARPSSEVWVKVDGGWECYAIASPSFGGGEPWGRPTETRVQVPWRQLPQYTEVGGLHPSKHPEMFDWIWPEERLVEIYAHAPAVGEGNQWAKVAGKYERV